MEKPKLNEYLAYPGPNAPTELQILARSLMRWLESKDITYGWLVEVYQTVKEGLEHESP